MWFQSQNEGINSIGDIKKNRQIQMVEDKNKCIHTKLILVQKPLNGFTMDAYLLPVMRCHPKSIHNQILPYRWILSVRYFKYLDTGCDTVAAATAAAP